MKFQRTTHFKILNTVLNSILVFFVFVAPFSPLFARSVDAGLQDRCENIPDLQTVVPDGYLSEGSDCYIDSIDNTVINTPIYSNCPTNKECLVIIKNSGNILNPGYGIGVRSVGETANQVCKEQGYENYIPNAGFWEKKEWHSPHDNYQKDYVNGAWTTYGASGSNDEYWTRITCERSVGTGGTPVIDTPIYNGSPVGHFDTANCSVIEGWAYDPDTSSEQILVHLYANAPSGDDNSVFLGETLADKVRQDVNDQFDITGNHGWVFNTPEYLKDGAPHNVYVYGINSDGTHDNNPMLTRSPLVISSCSTSVDPDPVDPIVPEPSDVSPVGIVDTVDNSTCDAISGWAYDPNFSERSININFYADALAGANDAHSFLGGTSANINRPDVNSDQNITGNHGFSFAIPNSLKDGATHSIHVYGINTTETVPSKNILLKTVIISGCTTTGVVNTNPSTPIVSGPTTGNTGVSYTFNVTATDPDGDNVKYGFDWDNNNIIDDYTDNVASGVSAGLSRTYRSPGTYTFNVYAEDQDGNRSSPVSYTIVITNGGGGGSSNNAPVISSVTGTTTGFVNVSYAFIATANDSDGNNIEYGFDWNNDGTIGTGELWLPAVASGVSVTRSLSWSTPGIKNFQVYARDTHGAVSNPKAFSIEITGGSSSIGFTLGNTTSLSTSEAGGTAVFTVVLNSLPLADVTLPVVSTDTSEGTVSSGLITFTPSNWSVYQSIIVSGVDDTVLDGNISYSVLIGTSTSSDINFNNFPIQTVNLINYDNEVASSGGGGGGGGGGGNGGPCRGFGCPSPVATTTTTVIDPIIIIDTNVVTTPVFAPKYCLADDFVADYMKIGNQNNPNEVRKLQYFLNTYENAGLTIDGEFGTSTEVAVMAFQVKYTEEVLAPWGTTIPTGIVYITTSAAINRIYCTDFPNYKDGDLNLSDGVLYPPTNTDDFNGVIGSVEATSTNIAGVFGAITKDIIKLLQDIPWYPLLVTLLILVGSGFIVQGMFKDMIVKDNILSFTQGVATLGLGSVLNVLNTVSFIISPAALLTYTGVGIGALLILVLINILALVVILITLLVVIRRKLMSGPKTI